MPQQVEQGLLPLLRAEYRNQLRHQLQVWLQFPQQILLQVLLLLLLQQAVRNPLVELAARWLQHLE
jgi:hypothetical protein